MSGELSKKSMKLTPNERAQIISEYNAGKEISNKDYYVVENKNGVLNVRRRKEKAAKEDKPKKHEKKANNYLTLRQGEGSYKIPIKSMKYDEGFLTIEQENTMFKIPAEEVKKRARKTKDEELDDVITPAAEQEEYTEPEDKPKAL